MNTATDTYRGTVAKAKRQAILKAARAQFLKNGYTRTGMTDIACDADVSTATLYKHFRSKEILFTEIVEQTSDHFKFDFPQPTDGVSLVDSFCVAARTGLDSYLASDMQPLLRIVIGEVPFTPELARETFRRVSSHWYNEAIKTLDDLIARGYLKPHDTNLSARLLVGMLKDPFIWDGLFHADHIPPADEGGHKIRALVELFLHRYGVKSQETGNVIPLRP